MAALKALAAQLALRTFPISLPYSGLERDFCRRRQTRKKALETMSPSEDQRLETTTREKWPQKRPFC
jgi:hypothetical protein